METDNLLNEIMFFVNMRLEDVAEEPKRLQKAQELSLKDIKTILEQYKISE